MDKQTKIIGLFAVGLTSLFLYKTRKNNSVPPIQGLSIEINPSKIVESVKPFINMDPEIKDAVGVMAKKFFEGYRNEKA